MLSLENISLVKYAVLLSLSPELKQEILCAPGSEYDVCKSSYQYYRKEQWNAIIVKKAKELMKHIKLPKSFEHKVLNILPAIALRMLIWAEYHEGSLDLDRYYTLNFLRFSHFTAQGVIDRKKAAEEIIKDADLSIKQKYKVACIYCLTNHISSFFKQIVGDTKDIIFHPENFIWMRKPEIVNFWTSELSAYKRKYKVTPRFRHCLQSAVKSGSTEAVKYSLEKTGKLSREKAHFFAVKEVLKSKEVLQNVSEKCDWIVFRAKRFDNSKESWIPNDYFVDILCFLLSNMTEYEQRTSLYSNIKYNGTDLDTTVHTTVLELFFSWPYQDYILKIAVLLNFFHIKTYAAVLLQICDKISVSCKTGNLLYGEERSYDYKKLLKDFWSQSPDNCKRYVFQNRPIAYMNGVKVVTTTGIGLLLKLLSLKNFTCEDEEMIWLILDSATDEEKANLTSAEWWRNTCISILRGEKFEIFDRLLSVFCKSEEKIIEFKKKLNLFTEASDICSYYLRYGKFHAVKSLVNRISLSEEQLLALKNRVIYSDDGTRRCNKLLSFGRNEEFEEFLKWFLPRNVDRILYKKDLKVLLERKLPVSTVKENDLLDFVTRFTRSNSPNAETVMQTGVAEIFGRAICEDLIMGSSVHVAYIEADSSVIVNNHFTGGQWGRVDIFLTWCLSTDDKILEFKKTLFKESGINIHYRLIKAEQWNVAKRFYNWLQLSEAEVKGLKERAMYDDNTCWSMLHYLVFEHDDGMYNLETIDLVLRWHLTDKKTVIKFRDDFLHSHEQYDEAPLKKFNSLVENYLDDLDQKEIFQTAEERFFRYLDGKGLKRKSVYFPQRKKMRHSIEDRKEAGNSNRRSLRLLNRSLVN